jgi:TPR repeat protein
MLLAGPSARADCKAGFVAFKNADYQEALSYLLPCAQAGDPAAQYIVGVIYDVGEGVLQNDVEAARWYRRAAEQGVAQAQYSLGESYASGEGLGSKRASPSSPLCGTIRRQHGGIVWPPTRGSPVRRRTLA